MCDIKVTDMFLCAELMRETKKRWYNYSGTAEQTETTGTCFKTEWK